MNPQTEEDSTAVRLSTSGLKFFKKINERGQETYFVSGMITNTTSNPVKDLFVQFWAVVELAEIPVGARTADEVVAIGRWRASQEVLLSGRDRAFEAALEPLSVVDQERLAKGLAGVSALGVGRVMKL